MSVVSHDRYYLAGDEDAGVGLHCLTCDTGGTPVIYYGYGHPDPSVPVTLSIDEFLAARSRHDMTHPAAFPLSNVTVRSKEAEL